MEDCNKLEVDCIMILFLLKLPCRLIRKLKEVISQKMTKYSKKESKGMDVFSFQYHDSVGSTPRISMVFSDRRSCECCMHEAEMVLEDLCKKGEFPSGSFWGRELGGSRLSAEHQEFDSSLVHIEVVGIGEALSIQGRNSSRSRRLFIYT